MKQFRVRFYKRVTTADRHEIVVEADSASEARRKVEGWGAGTVDLTDAEEATEECVREGEIVDGEFGELEDADNPYAVVEIVPEVEKFIIRSSYADITVRRSDGEILLLDYEAMGGKDEWDDVDHFDPNTFPAGEPEQDCLRVGFWTKDGKYVAPMKEEELRG